MKQNALDAPAKANGLAVLTGLVATGKTYDGKTSPRDRSKVKAARKARKVNR